MGVAIFLAGVAFLTFLGVATFAAALGVAALAGVFLAGVAFWTSLGVSFLPRLLLGVTRTLAGVFLGVATFVAALEVAALAGVVFSELLGEGVRPLALQLILGGVFLGVSFLAVVGVSTIVFVLLGVSGALARGLVFNASVAAIGDTLCEVLGSKM